jgi:hypothetical protein
LEAVVHAGDKEAAAIGGVEAAAAICEGAFGCGEFNEYAVFEVEGANAVNDGRDFLSVGTDVLDGCSADGAGDPGETFDTGTVLVNGSLDEGIPVFTGGGAVDFVRGR